ncbi:hypothetical protein CDO26_19160 (plasmid) [Sinorhizobium meliloti]|uniref:hypothetical protein n=1 Tax=Rhizobium meliloti TaxID=382 RepID=UPI000B4A2B11|nr:hypothetical protein [Sinorhizobium meliloti]ASP86720.1 hypothetical protein CDO26_19160 [Sinorhizobium meliloti]MQW26501.1 hypothetical protein [Sinorhizobium meliloti]
MIAAFRKAATACDQTVEQLLLDFMREYVKQRQQAEHSAWLRRQAQGALSSKNIGDLIQVEEAEAAVSSAGASLYSWRADLRRCWRCGLPICIGGDANARS